jgi:hypothetical protein
MNERHSLPVGGLVELSRATYQSTPLAVVEIRPTVFSFTGAGGTVTAVGGCQECAVIDAGSGPRIPEIRSATPLGHFTNRLAACLSASIRERQETSGPVELPDCRKAPVKVFGESLGLSELLTPARAEARIVSNA